MVFVDANTPEDNVCAGKSQARRHAKCSTNPYDIRSIALNVARFEMCFDACRRLRGATQPGAQAVQLGIR